MKLPRKITPGSRHLIAFMFAIMSVLISGAPGTHAQVKADPKLKVAQELGACLLGITGRDAHLVAEAMDCFGSQMEGCIALEDCDRWAAEPLQAISGKLQDPFGDEELRRMRVSGNTRCGLLDEEHLKWQCYGFIAFSETIVLLNRRAGGTDDQLIAGLKALKERYREGRD